MSQLLFPTPEDAPAPAHSQENLEGSELEAQGPINHEDKILRLVISGAIGLLIGVLEAVIVSNSLVEIANAKAFSIVRYWSRFCSSERSYWKLRLNNRFSPPAHRISILKVSLHTQKDSN